MKEDEQLDVEMQLLEIAHRLRACAAAYRVEKEETAKLLRYLDAECIERRKAVARAELAERQYAELREDAFSISTALLTRHEAERKALK